MLTLIGVVSIAAYRKFQTLSAVPTPRSDAGQVSLYFDRPGVTALLESNINPQHYGETEIRTQITVENPELDTVTYFLVYAGDARTREPYPNGDPSQRANGCWVSTWALPDTGFSCRSAQIGIRAGYTPSAYRVETQVLTGQIIRPGPNGAMSVEIRTSSVKDFSAKAGKRRYFALPAIGTPYVPESFRRQADATNELGDGTFGYTPARLDVAVDYGKLAQSDRVENLAPQATVTGSLTWVDVDASLVQASGSIVDTVAEERGQQILFMIAIYAGVASAVAPITITMIAGRIPDIFYRRRRPKRRDYVLSVIGPLVATVVPPWVAYAQLSNIADIRWEDVAVTGLWSIAVLVALLSGLALAWKAVNLGQQAES
jgi:hypothetical protein